MAKMNNKNFMKNILILLLAVFVLIPIIMMIFGLNNTPKIEGFYDMSAGDLSMVGYELSGQKITTGDNNFTGLSGEAFYCIGGTISCSGGYDASHVRTDADGVKIYQCISGIDISNDLASCKNGIFDKDTKSAISLYTYYKDTNKNWKIKNNSHYLFKSINYGGFDAGNFDNFTDKYTSAPFEISGQYLLFDDADVSKTPYSTCFLLENLFDCNEYRDASGSSSSSTTTSASSDTTTGITCNADYGSKVGDKLCCGQSGVVQNNSRVCPYDLPKCKSFKCGSQWGTCAAK